MALGRRTLASGLQSAERGTTEPAGALGRDEPHRSSQVAVAFATHKGQSRGSTSSDCAEDLGSPRLRRHATAVRRY